MKVFEIEDGEVRLGVVVTSLRYQRNIKLQLANDDLSLMVTGGDGDYEF